ncbi:hypothetical protein D3C78_1411780 [compost metagenome]
MGGELTHQHEQRNHRQVVVGQPRVGQVVEGEQQRGEITGIDRQEAGRAADQHGDADVHAQHQQGHGDGQGNQAETQTAHERTPGARQMKIR